MKIVLRPLSRGSHANPTFFNRISLRTAAKSLKKARPSNTLFRSFSAEPLEIEDVKPASAHAQVPFTTPLREMNFGEFPLTHDKKVGEERDLTLKVNIVQRRFLAM